jgi:PAS domain S-box-containing protein
VNNLLHEPAVKGIVVNSRDITERRQTEEALRQSEARYRAVIEQTIEGIYLGAADTKRVLESNAAFQRILGYTAEELRGMRIHDFVAHDRENIDSVFHSVLDKGHRFIGERRYRRKDGSEVEVESSATVISYGDKEVLCTVVRDVTKRREAEEVLKQSEERFRALTQNSSDFITLLRANGSVRYQGPSVERILGYRPEEMVGDNVFHYVHPEDLRRVEMAFAEGLKDPRRRPSAEYRFRHKDGWWVWLESVGTNLLDDPRVGEYVVNSRDITERKHAEEALRESEAKYRLLVEQTPAITYVEAIDEEEPEHNILYVSPQIEELLGYSPEEWMANPALWAGLLHPDDRERVLSEDARTEETGEPFSVEYRGFTKDGSLVWLYDEAVLVRDDSGRPLYWQGVKYDITERKKAEEELREANRRLKELAVLKADFTAMVAHELDTPLAVIRGYAEMLATGELEPAEQSRALAKIDAETEVLNTLVADVRAAASLEQEDFSIEAQRVPVRALLDAAARFGATLPGNHLLVTENAADERVWADPHRVGQVLRNLLSNAANYSSDGTPIELRAKPSETPGHVRIEVADCGPGIHPDDVSCVFEKFGRGRDQYGRKVQGTGLGLYLSRRIMQAHGSDLTLDQAPESGAVFAFELETAR